MTKKLYEIQIPVAPNEDNVLDERLTFVNKFGGLYKGIFSESHHENFLASVSHTAGGFTVLPEVTGHWVDRSTPRMTQYTEKMIPVRIFCTETEIAELAGLAKEHYSQEAIFVAELGTARFF